ncbi:MAG: hypothetical protein WC461_01340 [Candidatus Paceibacterota bacterium]
MLRLLNALWTIFSDAHEIEVEGGFRKLRNSLWAVVAIPLVFIIPGAFLGAWSWTLKVIFLQIGTWLAVFFLLWLSKKRLLIGTEIGAVVESTEKEKLGVAKALKKGLGDYIRVVAAILASEITVGLISLWVPAHQNPKMFFLIILVAAVIVAYKIWQEGKVIWPKIVHKMAVFTLIVSLLTIFFPTVSKEIPARIHPDDEIAELVKNTFPTPEEKDAKKQAQIAAARQIYPNYEFSGDTSQLKVPLLSNDQVLSRQAGGWIITPAGSEFRIDYNIPVTIEYNDGKKVYREPGKPVHDGVSPATGIFRLYGKTGEYVTITIKRGAY